MRQEIRMVTPHVQQQTHAQLDRRDALKPVLGVVYAVPIHYYALLIKFLVAHRLKLSALLVSVSMPRGPVLCCPLQLDVMLVCSNVQMALVWQIQLSVFYLTVVHLRFQLAVIMGNAWQILPLVPHLKLPVLTSVLTGRTFLFQEQPAKHSMVVLLTCLIVVQMEIVQQQVLYLVGVLQRLSAVLMRFYVPIAVANLVRLHALQFLLAQPVNNSVPMANAR
jgi:hypothetical protein